MDVTINKPDRTWRTEIESANGTTPSITVHRQRIGELDGKEFSIPNGSMQAIFNTENPLHVALEVALQAVIDELVVIRDTPTPIIAPDEYIGLGPEELEP